MRVRIGVVMLALISSLAGATVSATPPRAEQGNFRASVVLSPAAGELSLKSGFVVRWRAHTGRAAKTATLEVAKQRASAQEIAEGFVPIGPTVQLHDMAEPVTASFGAERFQVRAGHRLVFAIEREQHVCADAGPCSRWLLVPARYRDMRCVSENVVSTGLRMQFGSVPEGR